MRIKTMFDNILCKRIEDDSSDVISGIGSTEKSNIVEIIDIPYSVSKEITLENGDILIIKRFSGVDIEYKDEELLFITKHDILAKINKDIKWMK